MPFAPKDLAANISYSQIHSIEACSWQYALEKVFRVPTLYGWALAGGSAYHSATELADYAIEGLPKEVSSGPIDEIVKAVLLDSRTLQPDGTKLRVLTSDWLDRRSSEWLLEQAAAVAVVAAGAAKDVASWYRGEAEIKRVDPPAEKPVWPIVGLPLDSQVGVLKEAYQNAIIDLVADEAREADHSAAQSLFSIVGSKVQREEYVAFLREEHEKAWALHREQEEALPDPVRTLWRASLLHELLQELGMKVKKWESEDEFFRGDRPRWQDWKASGRKSEQWPEKKNIEWWFQQGLLMLRGFLDWRKTTPLRLAYIGEVPCIEVDVTNEILGAETKAYIDRIYLREDGMPVVVDIKTGQEPVSKEQLGLYATLIEMRGLPRPSHGIFWLSENFVKDEPKPPFYEQHLLEDYDKDFFEWKYGGLKAQRDAGFWYANTQFAFCKTCEVSEFCYAVGGKRKDEVPKPWKLPRPGIRLPIEPIARGQVAA